MGMKAKQVVVAVVLLALGVLVAAQVVKKAQGGLDDLKTADARTWVGSTIQPLDSIRAELASPALRAASLSQRDESSLRRVAEMTAGFDRLLLENSTGWSLQLDRRTGLPALVEGSGIAFFPGRGNNLRGPAQPTLFVAERATREFLAQHSDLLSVDASDLRIAPEGSGEFGGYLYYIRFDYARGGIPVEGAYLMFRFNHGNLIQFGAENVAPGADVDPIPSVDRGTALQILGGYIGGFGSDDEILDPGRLSFIPFAPEGDTGEFAGLPGRGLEYRLVYTISFRRPGQMGTWTAKVDAHSGEILSFADSNQYGSVTGGIYQNSNLDVEAVRPLPFLTVSGVNATQGGVYSQTSGTVTAALTGKYCKVTDSCGASSLSATAPATLAFGTSTGTDCTTPGVGGAGNTHAARSNYYHITNWKLKAAGWLPSNTWLQGQLQDNVNLNQTCNAYWNGSSVNFFKSGGGCSNTGELPTVFLHEAGHGLDSNDGGPASENGSGEAYADTCALLQTHQSCVGVNFIPGQQCSGYGNACTACTGIRDADYTKHTNSTTPAKASQLSGTSGYHCPTSASYKGPCGYEGHCEAYIMAEANWDLAATDLPAAGIDANTSWLIVDRLFYLSRATSGSAYACPSLTTTNGCGTSNWFSTYRAVDDDNGNLSDGTPHAAAIYAAFNRHAIACTTVTNTSSSSCPAIAQPTLTATAGSNSVSLSWGAVTNAAKYLVLRNEASASAGMTIVASPTTTSYSDTGLANGITYYYSVQAVGSTGACYGAMAAVKSATPSGTTTTYSISGNVTGATSVAINLTGAATASTTTDASGNYTFSGLANGTYTVTPSKAGYTFSPVSTSVTIASANQTGKNFTGTASSDTTPPTVSITAGPTGTITVNTASFTWTGTDNVTATANLVYAYYLAGRDTGYGAFGAATTVSYSALANGSYTFYVKSKDQAANESTAATRAFTVNVTSTNVLTSGVPVNGSVALQAYNTYTIAVPAGATQLKVDLTNLTADVDLYDKFGSAPTTASYTGRSWNGGTTAETLTHASPSAGTWYISAYGYAAGSYTLTATITTGTVTYSISGNVTGASTVTMNLTGASTASATTDASGNYTFSGLANGNYTVTPSKAGYTFSPVSTSVTISGANQTGKNFVGTASGGDPALTSGVGVAGSVALQAWKYYTIAVPTGSTNLSITLTGLSADIDLYVNNSATHPTTTSSYGSSTNGSTTNELLSYASPTVATWSVGVYGYAAGNYTVTATVTGGGGSTTLLSDGFEGTGWSTAQVSGTAGSWTYPASGTHPAVSPHGGAKLAMFNSYTATSGNQTRLYRTTGFAIPAAATSATLTFWMYHDTGYSTYNDTVTVQVSTNGGTTWTSVGTAISRYSATTGWALHTVSLTAYKGMTVNLGFLGISAYGNDEHLDDVLVTVPTALLNRGVPNAKE